MAAPRLPRPRRRSSVRSRGGLRGLGKLSQAGACGVVGGRIGGLDGLRGIFSGDAGKRLIFVFALAADGGLCCSDRLTGPGGIAGRLWVKR